jgi:gas vesicle protein
MDQPHTINLDGISYNVDQFSKGVQQAVLIYNKFTAQLQDQQLEVMKTQAALQQVGQQITEAVKKELEEKKAGVEDAKEHETNGADGEVTTVQ